MTDLDTAALVEWNEVIQSRLRRADLQRRNAPLREAMEKQMEATMTTEVPTYMADPIAAMRKSILGMEESQADFPNRLASMEAKNAASLERVRARTAMLQSWLEVLS